MRLYKRTKFIWPIGFLLVPASAMAAGEQQQEQEQHQLAPDRCEGLESSEESRGPQRGMQQGAEEEEREATGPLALIGGALQKVCLDDQQRQKIEQLADTVRDKEEAVADAREALRDAIAEQLKAGKIDENELRDEVDELVKAREAASPALRKAFQELHGILDPGQRKAFVDALRGRLDDLKKDAKGWREGLAKDLELNAEQKKRLGEILDRAGPAVAEERDRLGKVLDEFEKDDFSLDRVAPSRDVGQRTRRRAETMIGVAKELLTILSSEQRAILAEKLEGKHQHGARPGGYGPHQGTQPGGQQSATPDAEDQPDDEEDVDATSSPIVVARGGGFRAGGVRGWGYRGGAVRGGYVGGYRAVRTGYAAGYPLGGWGPGVWW